MKVRNGCHHYRQKQADGKIGGTLSGALLKRNHRHRDGSSEYHPVAVMEDIDISPSAEEQCKAPGNDGFPPEVIKVAKTSNLTNHLDELLLQCWDEVTVPQEMRDSNISTLYKTREFAATATATVECPSSVLLGRSSLQ